MFYTSLLYPSGSQEVSAHLRKDTKFSYNSQPKQEKRYKFIGTRMVLDEEQENEHNISVPCFYKDLSLDCLEDFFKIENGDCSCMLELSSDEETVYYRQNIMKDLEDKRIALSCMQFYSSVSELNVLLNKKDVAENKLNKAVYKIAAFSKWKDCVEKISDIVDKYAKSVGLLSCIKSLVYQIQEYKEIFDISDTLSKQLQQIEVNFLFKDGALIWNDEMETSNYTRQLEDILEISHDTIIDVFDFPCKDKELQNWEESMIRKNYSKLIEDIERAFDKKKEPDIDLINRISKELSFYINGLDMIDSWQRKGYSIAYGVFDKTWDMRDICELQLVCSSIDNTNVITNDVYADSTNGILITGDNQGGKTTYLKSIGQAVYLTLLGFPCIGSKISIPWIDGIYTHFSKEENSFTQDGKLVEELKHLRQIKDLSEKYSLILLNEMFSSTTILDGIKMSKDWISDCIKKEQYVFNVTHFIELIGELPDMISYSTHTNDLYKIVRGMVTNELKGKRILSKYNLKAGEIGGRICDKGSINI